MKNHRLPRINEVIREVAAETVLFKLRDPRVKGVTVTRAEIAADLQHAKVHVSIMGTDAEQRACLEGLASAAGYVQKQLGDRLKLRYTPVVHFVIDKGVKNSLEIARLLREERSQGLDNEPSETTEIGEEDPEQEAEAPESL